jgi:N,N-dimethylformamidase
VATDEDLHREGLELLQRYRVVVTGSHPEYITSAQYAAFDRYLSTGGRVMYLGANGFFWVTSFAAPDGSVVECRRGQAAQRNWTSHPAELHHGSTGELGGAWLHRGRNSRELFGVGMCAAGWGPASGYRRTDASRDPDLVHLFSGLDGNEVGGRGLVLDGAAGDELDSADFTQGTPSHARVLLTSRHGDKYLPTLEATQSIAPHSGGQDNPAVRADVVLMETARGGRVFSTGSICWAGAMAVDDYDNDIATLTSRVLADFLKEAP